MGAATGRLKLEAEGLVLTPKLSFPDSARGLKADIRWIGACDPGLSELIWKSTLEADGPRNWNSQIALNLHSHIEQG
jgi:hypothetical protein